jgi:hypothetical protein
MAQTKRYKMEKDVLLMLLNIESLLGGKGRVQKDTPEGVVKKINSINKFALDYLSSKSTKLEPSQRTISDWATIKSRLDTKLDDQKLLQYLDQLPPEVDQDEAAVAIAELIPKLKALLPINTSVTLTGLDEREPSDYEKSKFIRAVRVLENPMHVMDLIASDTITGTEIDALQLFYPSLYEALVASIVNALSDFSGKNGSSATLPLTKNRTISMILGVPRVSPTQMAVFQAEGQSSGDKAELKASGRMEATDTQNTLNRKAAQ